MSMHVYTAYLITSTQRNFVSAKPQPQRGPRHASQRVVEAAFDESLDPQNLKVPVIDRKSVV